MVPAKTIAQARGEGGNQPQLRAESPSSGVLEPDQIVDSEGNIIYGAADGGEGARSGGGVPVGRSSGPAVVDIRPTASGDVASSSSPGDMERSQTGSQSQGTTSGSTGKSGTADEPSGKNSGGKSEKAVEKKEKANQAQQNASKGGSFAKQAMIVGGVTLAGGYMAAQSAAEKGPRFKDADKRVLED